MGKPTLAYATLSLVVPADRAAEIEGDLIEQSVGKSSLWFSTQIALTALLMFRASILRNPVVALLLGYAVYELMVKAHIWGIRALRIHLLYELDLPRFPALIPVYFLLIALPFVVGAALIRLVPTYGFHAAAAAAALLLFRTVILNEGVSVLTVVLYVAMPMMLGALYASWRLQARLMTETTTRENP